MGSCIQRISNYANRENGNRKSIAAAVWIASEELGYDFIMVFYQRVKNRWHHESMSPNLVLRQYLRLGKLTDSLKATQNSLPEQRIESNGPSSNFRELVGSAT